MYGRDTVNFTWAIAGTKTHFESCCHVDEQYYYPYVTQSSVLVRKRVQPLLAELKQSAYLSYKHPV